MNKCMPSFKIPLILSLMLLLIFISCNKKEANPLTVEALDKIETLVSLMDDAKSKSIDITREETTLWFANEFLKFADWDEVHQEDVEKLFGYYAPFEKDKTKYSAELPSFERKKVIEILDKGIVQLEKIIEG